MSGIYLHIPFCRKACFYCDFHFSVNHRNRTEVLNAMLQEIDQRSDFFADGEVLESIYFGGGTPSVLTATELASIMDHIHEKFTVSSHAEVTFECNPDDLDKSYLETLKSFGINRLSVGIQSFDKQILQWMNRSHNSEQALTAVHKAAEVGFRDITIDLIYGVPQLDRSLWASTLDIALDLPINHLSAYSLTLEQNTPYFRLVQQQKYQRPDHDLAGDHYDILVNRIREKGWEHYEVSNFCSPGHYSRHNSAYWKNRPYLGIGPGAHSYDLEKRYWNISNNRKYVESMKQGELPLTVEELSEVDRFNEYVLTRLRTSWGLELKEVMGQFNRDLIELHTSIIAEWVKNGWLRTDDDRLCLTESGFLYADHIASELFDEDHSSHTSS